MNHALLGNHPAIDKIRELIKVVSDTSFNVLIRGETGTGKEVVARLLHDVSDRKKERFIKVNCAALPFTLLESELFGYEKGAFTGADRLKPGKFELASDGILFLDEIGDMPLLLQAKLLEVLQGGKFTRLGGIRDVNVNTWVIASTNHDLEKNIKKGLFREDLYYRLNIIRIELPPLRKRREDIPLLTQHFIRKYRQELSFPDGFSLTGDLTGIFQAYPWPGNVRELSSTILRLMVGDDPEFVASELRCNMGEGPHQAPQETGDGSGVPDPEWSPVPLAQVREKATRYIEGEAIKHALKQTGGNKRAAARMLRISFKTLYSKMESLGINREGGKEGGRSASLEDRCA